MAENKKAAASHLDSRQHDGNQVVVGEQLGAHHAAVAHVLDDGCGEERRECDDGDAQIQRSAAAACVADAAC